MKQTLWVLCGVFSCGFLGFVGYVIVALQTKVDRWWAAASFFAVVAVATLVAVLVTPSNERGEITDTAPGTVSLILMLVLWFGGGLATVVSVPLIWKDYDAAGV
ncbi:hypothetical protein P0W64_01755 [Tsukamurella sp. 8F]|uniref:hypothetical protein n=1 Tax=unclassified Tsukamurella TaxID=2633480 RepID=UPI0023BA0A16|nr:MULTISPECIES: hypothetical protein [unclassified Tsukamurella]MDF0531036.1 hypothetical protein [Tsukamurella sp. 8J]MDF0585497.1 hypothetical protein [Tsukamurella sp. 8F]